MRVAVYGGSFDPPHAAHVLLVSYVFAIGGFERVLVVPVYEHAFGKRLSPFEHRLAMCRACFSGFPGVDVLDIEAELPRPNYTVRLLERLKELHPDDALSIVFGSDVLAESAKWHAFERVVELAPPFIVPRKGHEQPGLGRPLLPELSSTEVRTLLGRRKDPAQAAEIASIVPRRVLEYIEAHDLYPPMLA
jgi:nicotinate-nucleotide adenylyltransferase